jgi:hypothetical protein
MVTDTALDSCIVQTLRRRRVLSEAELLRECQCSSTGAAESELKRALRHLIAESVIRRCEDGRVCINE